MKRFITIIIEWKKSDADLRSAIETLTGKPDIARDIDNIRTYRFYQDVHNDCNFLDQYYLLTFETTVIEPYKLRIFCNEFVKHLNSVGIDSIQRIDIYKTTENSYYPFQLRDNVSLTASSFYIEFINVEERHLEAYRDIMRNICGPAIKLFVMSGYAITICAYELEDLVLNKRSKLSWNQIHIGQYTEGTSEPDIAREFDVHLKSVTSSKSGYDEVFKGLADIRVKPYVGWSKLVFSLDLRARQECCRTFLSKL